MFATLFENSGLSLDRLQTLCEVAEKGSIGAATKGDPNRQTQFSRQIGELERFFGVDLLDRESRPYRLSGEGRELAKISRDYLGALHDFLSKCGDRPVRLTIGAGESMIQWLLMPMLDRVGKGLAGVSITMRNLRTREIIDELVGGEIDLGLVSKSAVEAPLKSAGNWGYGYRLFAPKSMRTNLSGKLKLGAIASLPLAVIGAGGNFRRQLAALAKEHRVELDIRLECSSYSQIATAILNGGHCGFLPEFAAKYLGEGKYHSYEIDGFGRLRRRLVLAWNPKRAVRRPVIERALALLG